MPNLNVKQDLASWLQSLRGGRRGETVEEVLDSVLRTAQGRMEALATYQGKTSGKGKAKTKAKPRKPSAAKARKIKADTEGKRTRSPQEIMAGG